MSGRAGGDRRVVVRRRPLYWQLLHLQAVRPGPVARALLGEGALALAAVLVLADVASAWLLAALPLAVAAVVKAHDLLAGLLRRRPPGAPYRPQDASPSS